MTREYQRTGRSDRANDLIELRDELAELDEYIARHTKRTGHAFKFWNARYFLRLETIEAAQRIIGAGCAPRPTVRDIELRVADELGQIEARLASEINQMADAIGHMEPEA